MLTVTIEGLDELAQEWHAATSALTSDIAEAVDESAKAGRGVARNLVPVRTGRLSNSIDASVTGRSDLHAEGEIVANAPHAAAVAHGSRPHELRARRGGALRFQLGGKTVFRRKVRHPGTQPNEFWERANYEARLTLESTTQRAVRRFCARLS